MERTNQAWLEDLRDDSPHQTEAINDLLNHLKRGVFAYLRTRSDLSHLAEPELEQMGQDFAQEAILKVKDNLDKFQGKSKFTTWAAKIAANHTISELRRARWRDYSLDALTDSGTSLQEILALPTGQNLNPDTENERRQVWQILDEVISQELTDRQRQALVAVTVDNVPISEVANSLNTNANNVYKLLHDARLKLKRSLQALDLDSAYILKLFE
ncbi:MAG: sigma-70 family RNA polymerase sigma factor [Anaerolineae bacterium]|nr:sigma-70 family RNA polymerase sigma factor [Anaerolineae bacterium]MCB0178576.1 sigma-70 family RNA polymerase sigma factor [Anaerolineae bacterium]MCB0224729.1 sigma-70 family RNA polymerase sigma factor [Anaerolineae bacterium]MCB9106556.1 sigma-70 family RNA polymerase sigma factor [Anaerolineales bacterium]